MMSNSTNFARRALAFVGFVLMASFSASAASIPDYKTRVENARVAADALFENIDTVDKNAEREVISQIRTLIPPTERVDWRGMSVDTANGWLAEKLDELEVETSLTARAEILTEISERLHAISNTVGELEATIEGDQTKDRDKQKLAEILRRDEYQKAPPQEPSLFQKWLTKFLEWLSKMWPSGAPTPAGESSSGLASLQFWLQILIYALVIALIGFVIYKFAPFLSRRFADREKRVRRERVILGERIAADQSAADLFNEAETLARDGDLRGAIRKGYIALLCDLSDRNFVRIARHKTNRDYLRDVQKNTGLFTKMTGLTRNFENNWYGLRNAGPEDWEDFRKGYHEAVANSEAR